MRGNVFPPFECKSLTPGDFLVRSPPTCEITPKRSLTINFQLLQHCHLLSLALSAVNYTTRHIFPNTRFAYLPTFTRTPGGSFSSLSEVKVEVRRNPYFLLLPYLRGDRPPGSQPSGMSKSKFRSFLQNIANYTKSPRWASSAAVQPIMAHSNKIVLVLRG